MKITIDHPTLQPPSPENATDNGSHHPHQAAAATTSCPLQSSTTLASSYLSPHRRSLQPRVPASARPPLSAFSLSLSLCVLPLTASLSGHRPRRLRQLDPASTALPPAFSPHRLGYLAEEPPCHSPWTTSPPSMLPPSTLPTLKPSSTQPNHSSHVSALPPGCLSV
jgi:hypothetical protein